MFHDSIRAALSADPRFRVVGEAHSASELGALLGTRSADVVLLGQTFTDALHLPRPHRSLHQPKTVVMAPPNLPPEVFAEILGLGVHGVVSIDSHLDDLVNALILASRGMVVFPGKSFELCGVRRFAASKRKLGNTLAARETQVLSLLAQGLSERDIGARLGIGQRTVQTYIVRVKEKLGTRSRLHAVALGVAGQLVSPYPPPTEGP